MNQLNQQTSPYLLQHAENPVDWYPWGDEALELARRLDMPILLSIGYSACHWCHVMAHESFEDEETARLMNEYFINIKVDREERPDLDKIYQSAHYLLTQRSGGWPLTLFLSPDDLVPFYAGTYFPPVSRQGLPGFPELLKGVADLYRNRLDEVKRQNQLLKQSLDQAFIPQSPPLAMGTRLLDQAIDELTERYDPVNGGFGRAPKFPHPVNLERLLRYWLDKRDDEAHKDKGLKALEMLAFSLKKMALGGVNDQIGGGFYRYSVDDVWMIPHFEKMLYDNGPLLALYAETGVKVGSQLFRRVAAETADWVMREMQSQEGGYFSSLDADSEGEEGKFYVWTREELESLLSEEEVQLFAARYGINRPANFDGRWLPHVYEEYEALEKTFSRPEFEIRQIIDMARNKLLAARSGRIWPGKDDKILTSWNALMIRGMAIAGRLLERPDMADSAAQALSFLQREHWVDGRLLATSRDGTAHLMGYLDDYAFLIDAILEMLQVRWSSDQLNFALALADVLLAHFEDREQGGFFFTADDHEQLLQRPKPYGDEAMPAGNAVAAQALARLGYLSGEPRYIDAAERCVQSASALIAQAPVVHCGMLTALEEQLKVPEIVVIRGKSPELDEWQSHGHLNWQPGRLVFAVSDECNGLPPALESKPGCDEHPIAYVCRSMECAPAITDLNEFANLMKQVV